MLFWLSRREADWQRLQAPYPGEAPPGHFADNLRILEALGHEVQAFLHLEAREVQAQADVGALAEGEVMFGVLAARVIMYRIGKGPRIAAGDVQQEHEEGTLRNQHVLVDDILEREAR